MRRLWNDYNLSIVLLALLSATLIAQALVGWTTFTASELTHGKVSHLLGQGGYLWVWLETTLANMARSFFQIWVAVLLYKYFLHRGSPEGRARTERMDRLEALLTEVLARLNDAAMRDYELAAAGEERGQTIQAVLERLEQRQDRRTTA